MVNASVIIISKNEAENLKMTVDSLLRTQNNCSMEIIVVDDGSKDNSSDFLLAPAYVNQVNLIKTPGLGTSNARNLGASYANGPILFFCDSHVVVPDYWLDRMLAALNLLHADILSPAVASLYQPEAIGYGLAMDDDGNIYWLNTKPSSPCMIPFACSCFMAIKKQVFESLGSFDRNYVIYGSEDAELSLRAWLFGYQIVVYPELVVKHLFKESYSYDFDDSHMNYNLLRMACTHFNASRLCKILNRVNAEPHMKEVVESVLSSGVWSQRNKYQKLRVHDDDWFFSTFNMSF